MAKDRLPMRKTREILRMKWDLNLSHRDVARSLGVSLGAVSGALKRASEAGLDWPTVNGLSEEELEGRLYARPPPTPTSQRGSLPDFSGLHAERLKPGVTLALLHVEYREANPDGYGYTQFCEYYRRWLGTRGLTMLQTHVAGDKLFVDYSGKKPHYTNAATGQQVEVELFVAVLGASNYAFAEVTATQRVPDFVASHVRAFEYFGGVPAGLVPDQLKSAVVGASRYEPDLQRTYEDLAEHYGTAVVPARPQKPRDKAKVEVGVQIAQRWILARMRNQTFFSLDELNGRVRELREELNGRTMRKYGASRRELFARTDGPALRPLPTTSYTFATWTKVRVESDYHVTVDGHAYSVPHRLVREKIETRSTATTVEVLRRGVRVAVHVRSAEKGGHTTKSEHMPVAHRKHLEWTPARIMAWTQEVGPSTTALVTAILRDRPHPEQGYRSSLAILRLEKPYGAERLERACARAWAANARSAKHVQSILVHGLDRLEVSAPVPEGDPIVLMHENVRGPAYYN